jgi:hypothetical protein
MTQNEKLFLGIGATLLAVYLYNRSKKNSVLVTAQPIDALTTTTSSGTIPATMGSGTIASAMVAQRDTVLALAPPTSGSSKIPPQISNEPLVQEDYDAIKEVIKNKFLEGKENQVISTTRGMFIYVMKPSGGPLGKGFTMVWKKYK